MLGGGWPTCYDFVDITVGSGPHRAFANDVAQFPYQSPDDLHLADSFEATDEQYAAIASSGDGLEWITNNPGPGDHVFLQFEMTIEELSFADVVGIDILINDYTEGATTTHEFWIHRAGTDPLDGTNWDLIGIAETVPEESGTDLTARLSCDFEDYIDPDTQTIRWGLYAADNPGLPMHVQFVQMCFTFLMRPQPTGTIVRRFHGRVTDAQTGQPIERAGVNESYTNADGIYCISAVIAEFVGFSLSASKEGYETYSRDYSWQETFKGSFDIELVPIHETAVRDWGSFD